MSKTALISGASSGFGAAIASALAQRKYRLIVVARRKERLQQVSKELSRLGAAEVRVEAVDLRLREEVEAMATRLQGEIKALDILINNAGLALGRSFLQDGDPDDWDTMLDTNVKGVLYLTRAVLPLIRRAAHGHIVNIGSIAGREVYPGGNVYCASKHALDALSAAMRIEFLPQGIRVSQVRPGLAETEFSLVRFKGDAQQAARVYEGYSPLTAADVAAAVDFVLHTPTHVCINDLEITPTAQANAHHLNKTSTTC